MLSPYLSVCFFCLSSSHSICLYLSRSLSLTLSFSHSLSASLSLSLSQSFKLSLPLSSLTICLFLSAFSLFLSLFTLCLPVCLSSYLSFSFSLSLCISFSCTLSACLSASVFLLRLTSDHADVVVIEVLFKERRPPLLVVPANDDEVGVCVASTRVTLQHLGHLVVRQVSYNYMHTFTRNDDL